MSRRVQGSFNVTIVPQPPDDFADGTTLGRMTIDKQFHGALDATSKGQMLTGMSSIKGSAGYVAIERVIGTLDGHPGSFILQHSGTMDRGAASLTLTVVPDSGTDALIGLRGSMAIEVANGKHAYDFTYSLGDADTQAV
jgi:hypothetical protein